MQPDRRSPDAATAPESDDPLVQCDGGDGWGCFIPHAHCVCQDEGTPTRRRASLLNRNPRPEDKWK